MDVTVSYRTAPRRHGHAPRLALRSGVFVSHDVDEAAREYHLDLTGGQAVVKLVRLGSSDVHDFHPAHTLNRLADVPEF